MRAPRRALVALLALSTAGCALPAGWYFDDGGTLRHGPRPAVCISSRFVAEDGSVEGTGVDCFRADGTQIHEDSPGWDCAIMGNLRCGL